MMYSASRSRRLSIVSIIQSYQQLEKNYGREGAEIIKDNCQITIAGGFAPSSETADHYLQIPWFKDGHDRFCQQE